jgi:hypothetical protein
MTTTLSVSKETTEEVAKIAEIEGRSKAEAVRYMVRNYYRTHCSECHVAIPVQRCSCRGPEL